MEIGPVAVCHFESFDSMWQQVHEMLYIERGEEQIADELAAYNPLIPKGQELVCTVMFEIDEPVRRKISLQAWRRRRNNDHRVRGRSRHRCSRGRCRSDDRGGKASSVQFLLPFTEAQIKAFREAGTQVLVGFKHEQYAHIAVMPEVTRAALSEDFS